MFFYHDNDFNLFKQSVKNPLKNDNPTHGKKKCFGHKCPSETTVGIDTTDMPIYSKNYFVDRMMGNLLMLHVYRILFYYQRWNIICKSMLMRSWYLVSFLGRNWREV